MRGNCQQLHDEGYTIIETAAPLELVEELRRIIVAEAPDPTGDQPETSIVLDAALILKYPALGQALLNPKALALAEFAVGRGFLLHLASATRRGQGARPLTIHADAEVVPAPFPEKELLLTLCWGLDPFTRENGSTLVLPGSHKRRRHPAPSERVDASHAIATACPPGSIVVWNGCVWHSNWARRTAGERVVLHVSYNRMLMRPSVNVGPHDELIAVYGERMAQILGEQDKMNKTWEELAADPMRALATYSNAKT